LREKAAALLACGGRPSHVALEVHVCRSTLYNWLDDPEFQAIIANIQYDERKRQRYYLLRLTSKAVEVIEGLLDSPDERVRLSAAVAVLRAAELDVGVLRQVSSGELAVEARIVTKGGEKDD
jgi:HEAT repeat protein